MIRARIGQDGLGRWHWRVESKAGDDMWYPEYAGYCRTEERAAKAARRYRQVAESQLAGRTVEWKAPSGILEGL